MGRPVLPRVAAFRGPPRTEETPSWFQHNGRGRRLSARRALRAAVGRGRTEVLSHSHNRRTVVNSWRGPLATELFSAVAPRSRARPDYGANSVQTFRARTRPAPPARRRK